ncbi:GNAT family N-acetyltransferase [Nonomuraea sp. NPDC050153]|uniref:GNAT family N-acetyltransferase n=1 Tax=Nonomuraea sp. NPDC050153 TaxID=3364359 RepID=UPI0037898A30
MPLPSICWTSGSAGIYGFGSVTVGPGAMALTVMPLPPTNWAERLDGGLAHRVRLVHPSHRRKGIATALPAKAEARFTGFGAFRADAMVLRDNTPAHSAWNAAGCDPQPQWSRWVKPLPARTGDRGDSR